MTCNKNYNLVSYLNDKATSSDKIEITQHLSGCPDCRAELQTIRKLRSLPQVTPSAEFTDRVIARARLLVTEPVKADPGLADYLKLALRYSPPWAISAAVHLIIFAVLSIIFIGPAIEKQTRETFVEFEQLMPAQKFPAAGEISIPDIDGTSTSVSRPEITLPPPTGTWYEKGFQPIREKDERLLAHIRGLRTEPAFRSDMRRKFDAQETEQAVRLGLKWLASAQSDSGAWEPDKYQGLKEYTVAVTGLSILSLMAEGNSYLSGEYASSVNRGINYLISSQSTDGLFGPRNAAQKPVNYMYNHAIATAAVLEDYLATRNAAYPEKEQIENAINQAIRFTASAQHKNGGWGYTTESTPDTSVTVWQAYALKLAQLADIEAASEPLKKSWEWWAYVTDQNGLAGYDAPKHYPNGPYALTAAAMFCRIFANQSGDELADKQAKNLMANLPGLQKENMESDLYCWFWASNALFLNGGGDWSAWNKHAKQAIVDVQSANGSWPMNDRWAEYGGRVYSTAIGLLTLQVYYRYPAL